MKNNTNLKSLFIDLIAFQGNNKLYLFNVH
jgi:hypothetical protein